MAEGRSRSFPMAEWELFSHDILRFAPYPEAKQTIARCKAVFTRYRCLEVLIMDNGPHFARDYNFTLVTSSPRYPCSNVEAKRAIRTVKSLLEKEEDFHKALLAFKASPSVTAAATTTVA